MQRAFRVVTPLAIHQEPVMVWTWREFNRGAPDAILAFLHVDGLLLPLREIAGQLHAPRSGRGEGKHLRSPVPSLESNVLWGDLYHV
jgi:hypothetical protein